jgi:hypothetical protein
MRKRHYDREKEDIWHQDQEKDQSYIHRRTNAIHVTSPRRYQDQRTQEK